MIVFDTRERARTVGQWLLWAVVQVFGLGAVLLLFVVLTPWMMSGWNGLITDIMETLAGIVPLVPTTVFAIIGVLVLFLGYVCYLCVAAVAVTVMSKMINVAFSPNSVDAAFETTIEGETNV